MENQISVLFTDGDFEKSMSADNAEHAISIAKNPVNWPIELHENYKGMWVVIFDGTKETVLTYSDL